MNPKLAQGCSSRTAIKKHSAKIEAYLVVVFVVSGLFLELVV